MTRTIRCIIIAAIFALAFASSATTLVDRPTTAHAYGNTVTDVRGYSSYARITGYTLTGYTYGGTWTTVGRTAACSWDIPLWSVVIVGGDSYVCEDRGLLGGGYPYSWVDIYAGGSAWWVPATYGDYQAIVILPPYD